MSARHKLNAAAVSGALVIAGLVGIISGSGWLFLLVAGVLIALAVHDGDIRLQGGRR